MTIRKCLLIFLLLMSASFANAYVTQDGVRFAACNNCVSDDDFRRFAQLHYEEFNGPSVIVVVNTSSFFYLDGELQASSLRQLRRNISVTIDRSNPFEPTFTTLVSYDFEAVNPAYPQKLDEWLEVLGSIRDSHVTNLSRNLWVLELGDVSIDPEDPAILWHSNADFSSEYESLFNDAVATTNYNPFQFVDKPLTIRVKTDDHFDVTLARKFGSDTEWEVLFTTLASGLPVDSMGNSIELIEGYGKDFRCAPSGIDVLCRKLMQDGKYDVPLYLTSPYAEVGFTQDPNKDKPGLCQQGNCKPFR